MVKKQTAAQTKRQQEHAARRARSLATLERDVAFLLKHADTEFLRTNWPTVRVVLDTSQDNANAAATEGQVDNAK